MCRLFGFRSILQSGVHRSLMSADNALGVQSEFHPDGWGVAYYLGGAPHLLRSDGQALNDRLFHRVSGIVSSETVVAHIRKATQGANSPLNSHPFQFGPWIFAHNGNIKDFSACRPDIEALLSPRLRSYVLGDTDSEVFFYLFLSNLARETDPFARELPPLAAADAMLKTVEQITAIAGPMHRDTAGPPTETYLTAVATNGRVMAAHQGGKELYFSTHKTLCPERGSCHAFGASCEAPPVIGDQINHLIITSEPLQGDNVWEAMSPGEIVAVDQEMVFQKYGEWTLNASMI